MRRRTDRRAFCFLATTIGASDSSRSKANQPPYISLFRCFDFMMFPFAQLGHDLGLDVFDPLLPGIRARAGRGAGILFISVLFELDGFGEEAYDLKLPLVGVGGS